jgi:RNA-directed DNA polymerase
MFAGAHYRKSRFLGLNCRTPVRGWVNYFHYRNSSLAMSKVRNHAEERLRTHLRKRHKVKDRGSAHKRFRSVDLYARYGVDQ